MRTEVIIFSANHYEMDNNRGLSVRVMGDNVETNNKFGVEISEAAVTQYQEKDYLQRFGKQLPAKFKADLSLGTIKDKGGKEKTGVTLKNLEFVHSLELVEKKIPVKS